MTETLAETEQGEDQEGAETAPDGTPEPETEEEEAAEVEAQPAEPDAPEAAQMSEKEIDKRFDRLARRATTWRNTVSEVLGELAQDLEPCPRCLGPAPGFILPLSIKPVDPEQKVAVKLSIGELAEPDLKPADDAFVCGKCDGWGEVLTGSRKQAQLKAKCLECDGRGWVGARVAKIAQLPSEQRAEAISNGDEPGEPAPMTDPWGRVKDDPLYGIMPGYERD